MLEKIELFFIEKLYLGLKFLIRKCIFVFIPSDLLTACDNLDNLDGNPCCNPGSDRNQLDLLFVILTFTD